MKPVGNHGAGNAADSVSVTTAGSKQPNPPAITTVSSYVSSAYVKGEKDPDARMVQWRYAGTEGWTDAVQEDIGICADTWRWTEIPLDVTGDTDLTTSRREVELVLRTIGWDDQRSAVAAHTVEWKLMEVGDLHEPWNPTLNDGAGGMEYVTPHLGRIAEPMQGSIGCGRFTQRGVGRRRRPPDAGLGYIRTPPWAGKLRRGYDPNGKRPDDPAPELPGPACYHAPGRFPGTRGLTE